MRKAVYATLLALALIAMWAVLSDKLYKPLIVSFGAFGIVFAVAMSFRMGLIDEESAPFPRLPQFLSYWGWLGDQIVRSNVYVLKAVMRPKLDIHPVMTRVPVKLHSDLARATFANSITLTPGTVTVEVEETGFLVHGLSAELVEQEGLRNMEARSRRAAEGESS